MTYKTYRSAIQQFSQTLYDFDEVAFKSVTRQLFAPDAVVHLPHPFGSGNGPDFLIECILKLQASWPDLERRDFIRVAGPTPEGQDWAGAGGHYTGVFLKPWLDIPPTGHQVAMRFHEFFRFVNGQVVEMHALWDIPEVMVQAGAWPMAPQLGKFWQAPAPATQDGLIQGERDELRSQAAYDLVYNMLNGLQKHDKEGVKAMGLEDYWHEKMNWYGPVGIGTNRGIQGFRHWHQKPFLKAMPNRGSIPGSIALFGDGDYVGVTGWPNMYMNVSGDGFMGIVPPGKDITMKSLDFWRCEGDKIRENWVLVDILDVYHQLGVDVFERMRELAPWPLNRGTLPG